MQVRVLGLAAVLAAFGCAKGDALVVVTVSSLMPTNNVSKFHVSVNADSHMGTFDVPLPAAPVTITDASAITFGTQVPAAYVGSFDMTVNAVDASGTMLISGSNSTTTSAGQKTSLSIVFGVSNVDGGLGDGGPGDGGCATTCEEAGVGCGMAVSCGVMIQCTKPCGLTSVEPVVARAGDTITLEGRFGSGTMVKFTGGATAPASLLGAERATVQVPAGAITGPIVTTSPAGGSQQGVDLKIVTFPIGLQSFSDHYPQLDAARTIPQLRTDRSLHAVLTVGKVVLVVGGTDNGPSGTALTSIETANVNADGTLQPFNQWATSGPNARMLVTARSALSLVRSGNNVYAIGGWNNGATGAGALAYASIEQAQINGDGTGIQTFTNSNVSLLTARYLATTKIIGSYLYVFGGITSGSIYDGSAVPTASVERSPIAPNGALGPFEAVPGSALPMALGGVGVEVIGNTVYVLGGFSGTTAVNTIQKASIMGDGTIGAFTDAGVMLDDIHAVCGTMVMGDTLYLLGGIGKVVGKPMPDNIAGVVASPIGANDALGAFQPVGPMRRVRAAFGQPVLVGNQLYVVGGGGGGGGGPMLDVEQASINASGAIGPFATYTSSTAAHRTAPATVVVGDRLYLFGGQTAAALTTIESAPISPDGTLGMFTLSSTSLGTARSGAGIAILNGQIYVYGGGPLTGEVFNVNQDGSLTATGSTPTPLTTARSNMQMLITGGYLYAIGGDGAANSPTSMERALLDNAGNITGTFALTMATFANAHADYSGALIGGSYYLFGGLNLMTAQTDVSLLDSVGALTNVVGATTGMLGHPRWGSTAALVGDHLLLLGGNTYASGNPVPDSAIDTVPIVPNAGNVQLGASFATLPSLSLVAARRAAVSTVVGNYIYVMNGYSSSGGDLSSVERAPLK